MNSPVSSGSQPAAVLGDWFGEFFGIRVYLVLLECAAFFLTAYALQLRRNFWLVLVFWAVAPLTVIASTLVVQDEVISLFFGDTVSILIADEA